MSECKNEWANELATAESYCHSKVAQLAHVWLDILNDSLQAPLEDATCLTDTLTQVSNEKQLMAHLSFWLFHYQPGLPTAALL